MTFPLSHHTTPQPFHQLPVYIFRWSNTNLKTNWPWNQYTIKQLLMRNHKARVQIISELGINNNCIIYLLIDCRIPWRWRHYRPSKHKRLLAQWHDVTSLKTWIFFVINHVTHHVILLRHYAFANETDTVELYLSRWWLSRSPIIWIGLALPVNLSRILQKLTCLEITGYRIKYTTVLWLIELQVRGWFKGLDARELKYY
jgi:hypothetical protein